MKTNCTLEIPCSRYFCRTACSFVKEIAEAYGAEGSEKSQLYLATEEIFSYILSGIPADEDLQFSLKFQEAEDGVRFIFSNRGLPMNARKTGVYDPDNISIDDLLSAEKNMDSLSLLLAKNATDDIQYENRGSEGWQIVIYKRLRSFSRPHPEEQTAGLTELDKKFTKEILTSQDVPEIISLVYRAYRYSYAKVFFYNEQTLARAIDDKEILVIGIRNSQREIIGLSVVFFDTPCLAEMGAAMTDPAYRQSTATIVLVKHLKKLLQEEAYRQVIFYVKLVTTHTMSQRLMCAAKTVNIGFRLSVHDNANFIGIANEEQHRESLLMTALINEKKPHKRFCIPAFVRERVVPLLDGIYEWEEITEAEASELPTAYTYEENLEERFAELWVKNVAPDFGEWLKQQKFLIQQRDIITCILHLPTKQSWPADTREILDKNHFFFSGIFFDENNDAELVFTNLFQQKFDFSLIKLHDSGARELLAYVEQEYLRVRM